MYMFTLGGRYYSSAENENKLGMFVHENKKSIVTKGCSRHHPHTDK